MSDELQRIWKETVVAYFNVTVCNGRCELGWMEVNFQLKR